MDDFSVDPDEVVQLTRLSVEADARQVVSYAKRVARRLRRVDAERAEALLQAIIEVAKPLATSSRSLRRAEPTASVRIPTLLEDRTQGAETPILLPVLKDRLQHVLLEWQSRDELIAEGLMPARTIVFTGPPGVGKTMSARWLARSLEYPLYVLDLARVIGSRLGESGTNLKAVFEFARSTPCVLLLDEFDAVAARRAGTDDIGEMRRVVTVLLQEIDRWSCDSLLVAATNHAELIDPAVWRRFDERIDFPLANNDAARMAFKAAFGERLDDERYLELLARCYAERSFSDIMSAAMRARKRAFLKHEPLHLAIEQMLSDADMPSDRVARREVARSMLGLGFSQRKVSNMTGMSRDTLRKLTNA